METAVNGVVTGERSLLDYQGLVPDALLTQLRVLGRGLEGRGIVHVNATAEGGGVSELLKASVPLMRDLGADATWHVPEADISFFGITKSIHNYVQGSEGGLSNEEFEHYLACNREAAKQIEPHVTAADVLVVHDPQYLPLRSYLTVPCPAVWVCHIDATSSNEEVRELLFPYLQHYDAVVFSMEGYVFPSLDRGSVRIIPPAIDPLSPKNLAMPVEQARGILADLGLDPQRPIMTQVSRFDIWKDPWGVVDSYRIAKQSVPDLQLALVGVFDAQDDAEAIEIFQNVKSYVNGEPGVHLFTDPADVKQREVNAFQTGSDIIVQKSTREGFGLVVAEAMWKGKPVIGGDCGGIRLQIRDGETGFLVNGAESCAERAVQLLQDRPLAEKMGRAAKDSVARNYLVPRLTRDYLSVASELLSPAQQL